MAYKRSNAKINPTTGTQIQDLSITTKNIVPPAMQAISNGVIFSSFNHPPSEWSEYFPEGGQGMRLITEVSSKAGDRPVADEGLSALY